MYPRFVSMDDTVLYTRKRRDASGVRVTPPPPRLKLVGSVGVSTSIIFANELEGVVGGKSKSLVVLSAVVVDSRTIVADCCAEIFGFGFLLVKVGQTDAIKDEEIIWKRNECNA